MNHRVVSTIMLAQFVDLGMTVVTACNAVICPCSLNLCIFNFSIFKALVFKTGLQKTTAAAAAIVIGSIRLHIYKVFFPYNGFDDKSQILCNRVSIAFSDNLARILNCKFNFKIFIPI